MIPELHGCEEAEDFFRALGVSFDPAALSAHRLPILRRFGELLVEIVDAHPGAEDARLRPRAGRAPGGVPRGPDRRACVPGRAGCLLRWVRPVWACGG